MPGSACDQGTRSSAGAPGRGTSLTTTLPLASPGSTTPPGRTSLPRSVTLFSPKSRARTSRATSAAPATPARGETAMKRSKTAVSRGMAMRLPSPTAEAVSELKPERFRTLQATSA